MHLKKENIRISRVGETGIADLVRHRIAYVTEMQGKIDDLLPGHLETDLLEYFHEHIPAGDFVALVAEAEGMIIGYGGMLIRQVPGDLGKSSYTEGDILNMYTVPEFRRQGISTMILSELLALAKSMGMDKVALHTSEDGEKLYRSFGFSEPVYPYLEKNL